MIKIEFDREKVSAREAQIIDAIAGVGTMVLMVSAMTAHGVTAGIGPLLLSVAEIAARVPQSAKPAPDSPSGVVRDEHGEAMAVCEFMASRFPDLNFRVVQTPR